ncbi:MAG: hypothetical protein IPN95_03715 [Bacteroidetes bacterium]|nr:hypothetical protein [Bacteroidota bacterium]
MMRRIFLLVICLSVTCLFGCKEKGGQENTSSTPVATDSAKVDSVAAPKVATADSATLMNLAKEILQFAEKKDFGKIADYIHPTAGIRFSPYAYVDTAEHKHFTADAFRVQATTDAKKKVLWGTYDPIGDDIKVTVEAYFKEFGYDKNYLGEGQFGFNETMGGGTVINNTEEIYPGLPRVETYWAPKDEEKAPYEWGTIRLVFKEHEGKFYLVAWIHDAWNT